MFLDSDWRWCKRGIQVHRNRRLMLRTVIQLPACLIFWSSIYRLFTWSRMCRSFFLLTYIWGILLLILGLTSITDHILTIGDTFINFRNYIGYRNLGFIYWCENSAWMLWAFQICVVLSFRCLPEAADVWW
jgi:hypothetical protein